MQRALVKTAVARITFPLTAFALIASVASNANAQHHRRRHHGTTHPHGTAPATAEPDDDPAETAPAPTPAAPAAPAATATTAPAHAVTARTTTRTVVVETAPPPTPAPVTPAPRHAHLAAFDAQIGPRLFGRHLAFTDDLFQALRPYDIDFAPSVAGAIEWYPAAHFTQGIPAYFGIVATGDYAIGVASHDAQNHSFPTTAYGFSGALRARMPLGPVDAGVLVGYGRQAYLVSNAHDSGDDGIPSVDYQFIRIGASARWDVFSRLAVVANVGYLAVVSTGEIGSSAYFPRLFAGGFEAGGGVAIPITQGLEVRALADYRRYFYTMNPMRDDPFIAGGALDEYWSATIAAAYRR